jgi:hypothetical protein
LGESLDAHALFQFSQHPVPAEDVVQFLAHPVPGGLQDAARPPRRRSHVVAVQPIQFVVEIFGQQPFLRAELEGIGKILLQLFQVGRNFAIGPAQTGVEFNRQRAQQVFVGVWMQPPDPRDFARLFNQAQGVARAACFLQQHADVDPLVAHQIRRVAQDAVT